MPEKMDETYWAMVRAAQKRSMNGNAKPGDGVLCEGAYRDDPARYQDQSKDLIVEAFDEALSR